MSEIIRGMSAREYHNHPALGSSSLKQILRSIHHFEQNAEDPDEPNSRMQFGTAFHLAALEPRTLHPSIAIMPTFTGNGMRARKEEWLIENKDKIHLTEDQMENIKGMLKSLLGHKTASTLLVGGEAETSIFWTDPTTGVQCKCRPDYWRPKDRLIIDIKTTTNASSAAFQKVSSNLHYHLSAAHYLSGASIAEQNEHDLFWILAVETDQPYGVQVFEFDAATIEKGKELQQRALLKLKNWMDGIGTHGYSDEIVPLGLPPWSWNE